ncbi:hypothetical protein JKG47_02845 [Acidithiobacillus sp. MC6.1]|nr:hypothetical protein [Acidithiobacillus sp. MC6.1]
MFQIDAVKEQMLPPLPADTVAYMDVGVVSLSTWQREGVVAWARKK